MKAGCRPPYVGARRGVLPEHPTYWQVTPDIEAAVELLVADGQIEYEPSFTRGAGGHFAVQTPPAPAPALELVPVVPAVPPGGPSFARKKGR